MSGKTFIDSSILIYAHDADAGKKRATAARLIEGLWSDRLGVLSLQVLQEFYMNVTRKISSPLSRRTARSIVNTYSVWCVETTPAELAAAFRIEDEARIGFWDALIVAAALKAGADRILSEDLNSGRRIRDLRIENPFRS
ncbi:MAG TPA: PIN domain-containing protein [Acidobacteriaceae bacterium]